jgi:hypothetical protein
MSQSRAAPMPAADSDGEEAHYSCRICFEDAKPSEVGWVGSAETVAVGHAWKADVATLQDAVTTLGTLHTSLKHSGSHFI